jgi:hypothetical protein
VDFDIPSLDVNEVTTHNNDKYGDLVCAFSFSGVRDQSDF